MIDEKRGQVRMAFLGHGGWQEVETAIERLERADGSPSDVVVQAGKRGRETPNRFFGP